MRVLFTGFTSRTVGSDRNVYDYLSNVDVLRRALTLAGHEVDARPVSLETDPCVEEDYDVALVGIAACQGLSSRYKLGALWALHRFGARAGLFPSDGKNIYVFPSSVRTCLTGEHRDNQRDNVKLDPIDYMLGALQRERNNVVDAEAGGTQLMKNVWRKVLADLPHDDRSPACAWPMLVPTFSWGDPQVYARHFGARVVTWDPTNIAIPMQFHPDGCTHDGRFPFANQRPLQLDGSSTGSRERAWVVSSLQDQSGWIRKQKCAWPVITIGNKRAARDGEGADYVPERELIGTYYRKYWGHLAFGYPLAEGGWWRMRYVHAGMAGIVTCCDEADARRMPPAYRHSRIWLERAVDAKLADIAEAQWLQLRAETWSADTSIAAVDGFVWGLAS